MFGISKKNLLWGLGLIIVFLAIPLIFMGSGDDEHTQHVSSKDVIGTDEAIDSDSTPLDQGAADAADTIDSSESGLVTESGEKVGGTGATHSTVTRAKSEKISKKKQAGATQAKTQGAKTTPSIVPKTPLVLSELPSSSAGGKTLPNEEALKAEIVEKVEPCLFATFETRESVIKGKLQELLVEKKIDSKRYCVFVDGKPVDYSKVSKGRIRLDWKLTSNKAEVTALYCNQGKKCNLKCPEAQKDFWDEIGAVDTDEVGVGFADETSSDEVALQKELKTLKEVLNRKPPKAKIAVWKQEEAKGVSCQQTQTR